VNGGLARRVGRRVKPSAGASCEGRVASRPHRPRRERTGERPRVARERHSAGTTSPKAVAWSWDRGCNDHRILWRVSCRRKASRIITRRFRSREALTDGLRRSSASSDPCTKAKSRGHGQVAALAKAKEAEDVGAQSRQGCQRLDRISAVGRKRPRPWIRRKATSMGLRVASRSAEAVSGRRETLDSPGHAVRSLRLREASPPRKRRTRAGNTRGAGTRSSFGWQISVERIARLSRLGVARPAGDGGR